jgi:glycosyltransferase involved in cell wall biosynthesis
MYGAENVLLTLAKEMRGSDYVPVIGVFRNSDNPNDDLSRAAQEDGIETVTFPCNGKFDLRTVFAIRRFIFEHRIQIIHTHNYKSNFYGLMASLFTQARLMSTCHNWITTNRKLSAYSLVDQYLLRFFDVIVTVSENIVNTLLAKGVNPGKIVRVLNGVCLDKFNGGGKRDDALRKEFGIPLNCSVVGTVGRLSPEKGYELLLQAGKDVLKTFPDAHFMIVGDGPQKDDLRETCDRLGLNSRVIFTGKRRDIGRLYSIMDIFVISSHTEGLPMVLLEAMASGVPVIATKVGSIPDVVSDGVNGLLVESGNVRQIREAIENLLMNPEMGRRYSLEGRRSIRLGYSSKVMAENYFKIYSRLVSNGGFAVQ